MAELAHGGLKVDVDRDPNGLLQLTVSSPWIGGASFAVSTNEQAVLRFLDELATEVGAVASS